MLEARMWPPFGGFDRSLLIISQAHDQIDPCAGVIRIWPI